MTKEKPTGVIPAVLSWPTGDHIVDFRAKLREELRAALQAIPSADELKDFYPSRTDREKFRRRLMLKAVHQLVSKNILCDPNPNILSDGSIEIDIYDTEQIKIFNALSAAIRDFNYDADRLDQGYKAELVLEPINYEGIHKPELISAARKIVLLALLFIDMRPLNVTEKKQCEIAAELTGLSSGTLRTYLRNIRAAQKAYKKKIAPAGLTFSKSECNHYADMEKRMLKIVGRNKRNTVAGLIAPGLRGLCVAHQKIRTRSHEKG